MGARISVEIVRRYDSTAAFTGLLHNRLASSRIDDGHHDEAFLVFAMTPVSFLSRGARIVRLLLDIYGALVVLIVAGSPVLFGLSPYEGLLRLGAPGFYTLLIGATLAWGATIPVLWRWKRS